MTGAKAALWIAFAYCLVVLALQQPAEAQTAGTAAQTAAHTRLVILGGAAGRTSYRGIQAGSMSAAVQVGRDVYMVDFGSGWLDAYFQSGLGGSGNPEVPGGLETLRAGFITHLHADHVADYGRLLQFGTTDGLQKRKTPVKIYGPGRVADTALSFRALRQRDPKLLVRPDNPSPGIEDVTRSLIDAFAADINDNMSDGGRPHPSAVVEPHDIVIPPAVAASPVATSPRMRPIEVYKDENITVLATLVDHAPMFPAYAFRFETPDGVIVFSGDTNRNENLIELARGADILVHEAIDMNWPRRMLPEPRSAADEAKLRHLLEAHTDVTELGGIAQAAGVKMLVISHLAPPTTPDSEWLAAIKGFPGKVAVGRRLFSVSLPLQ